MGEVFDYVQYIKVSGKFLEPIDSIAKVSIYRDEQKILKGFVHNKAEQKINYYNKKIAEMKKKYNMDFLAFQNKIYLGEVEVDLEGWNDFVLWGGYVKAYKYWAQFC